MPSPTLLLAEGRVLVGMGRVDHSFFIVQARNRYIWMTFRHLFAKLITGQWVLPKLAALASLDHSMAKLKSWIGLFAFATPESAFFKAFYFCSCAGHRSTSDVRFQGQPRSQWTSRDSALLAVTQPHAIKPNQFFNTSRHRHWLLTLATLCDFFPWDSQKHRDTFASYEKQFRDIPRFQFGQHTGPKCRCSKNTSFHNFTLVALPEIKMLLWGGAA